MSDFVVDAAQAARLAQVRDRLRNGRRREMSARMESMSLADVVDEFWPAADGWTTVSVEPGFTYVMTLLEHPTEGVAACLLGAIPTGTDRQGRVGNTGTPEQWESLSGWSRATWVEGVLNAQAPSRPGLVARMQAIYEATEYPSLASTAPAGFLLASPVFMDEVTRMFVALGDERLVGHAMTYQRVGRTHSVPDRPLLVGAAAAQRAWVWASGRPMLQAAQQAAAF
jgi:hypothetical protein